MCCGLWSFWLLALILLALVALVFIVRGLYEHGRFLVLGLIWHSSRLAYGHPLTLFVSYKEKVMTISVYIDNNVWDFLYSRKIDLSVELPRTEFCLCMTREAEFEIPPIPIEKAGLKKFIQDTINKCVIEPHSYFGFYDPAHSDSEQRVGGFNQGRFASLDEVAFIEQQKTRLGTTKKALTKLYKNEADISVAARAIHSVVLTLDKKVGPINDAYKQGGNVVFLNDFDSSGLTLKEFILHSL